MMRNHQMEMLILKQRKKIILPN